MLENLYSQKLDGNRLEFTAYKILYAALNHDPFLALELGQMFSEGLISVEDSPENTFISHSLRVLFALQTDDYHSFFREYKVAPTYSKYLMRSKIDSMRSFALKSIAKS